MEEVGTAVAALTGAAVASMEAEEVSMPEAPFAAGVAAFVEAVSAEGAEDLAQARGLLAAEGIEAAARFAEGARLPRVEQVLLAVPRLPDAASIRTTRSPMVTGMDLAPAEQERDHPASTIMRSPMGIGIRSQARAVSVGQRSRGIAALAISEEVGAVVDGAGAVVVAGAVASALDSDGDGA